MRRIAIILSLLNANAALPGAQHSVAAQLAITSATNSNLEFRILPRDLDRGLPKSFTFVFINKSDHRFRMPRPSHCSGGNGTVLLRSDFKPLNPQSLASGKGGGCGGGLGGEIQVLEWVKSWQALEPGESLRVTYSRQDLFNMQEDAGDYEFWGEYVPPKTDGRGRSSPGKGGV